MQSLLSELLMAINGKVDSEYLFQIQNQMSAILENYNIEKKSTELVVYTGYIPECYKVYLVNAKINGISENTIKLYNLVLTDFFARVDKPLEEITTNMIRAYLYNVKQDRGISDRTLDNRRVIVNAFFEWCANEEYIPKNPCRSIKKIKYVAKEREPISDVDFEKLRNACKTKRDRALLEFFYSTGCRVSELINVKKDDVDFASGEIVVFGKGRKYRTVYLSNRAKYYLKEYLKSRTDENEYLFVSNRSPFQKVTKECVEKNVKLIGERAGVEHVFPHRIRHTTATDCLQHGMDITDVQSILGHSNINTTMIYAKVDKRKVKSEHLRCIG